MRSMVKRTPARPRSLAHRTSPWVVLVASIAMDATALVPVGLTGAFAITLQEDLGVGSGFIGITVTAFFLTGSLTAVTAGARIDAFGSRKTACGAVALTALAAWLIAGLGLFHVAVVGGSMLAGAAFSMAMPATNAILGSVMPANRRILAVCIKQSAVPVSLLLATISVPVFEHAGGWRTSYALAGVMAVLVVGYFARVTRHPIPQSSPADDGAVAISGRAAQRTVARFGIGSMLASLLPGALTGFAALSLTEAGSEPALTALVLTVANASGITVRLLSGVVAQRYNLRSWLPVTMMMIVGSVGAFFLATGVLWLMIVGALLAFGLGWGWSGLTYALVLVSNPDNPGSTGALLQAGGMLGSASGPLLMAATVDSFGLAGGWMGVGTAILIAGIVVAPGTRRRTTDSERS
ncbi:MFS transporter [Rhodococcus sp. WS4]|nr:MFS transporter [Rhodococcus sp. WS4]